MLRSCHLRGEALAAFSEELEDEVELRPPTKGSSDWLLEVRVAPRRQERLSLPGLLDLLPEESVELRRWAVEHTEKAFAASLDEGKRLLDEVSPAHPHGLTQALRLLETAVALNRQLHRARVEHDLSSAR